jgi:hypothetical protein
MSAAFKSTNLLGLRPRYGGYTIDLRSNGIAPSADSAWQDGCGRAGESRVPVAGGTVKWLNVWLKHPEIAEGRLQAIKSLVVRGQDGKLK